MKNNKLVLNFINFWKGFTIVKMHVVVNNYTYVLLLLRFCTQVYTCLYNLTVSTGTGECRSLKWNRKKSEINAIYVWNVNHFCRRDEITVIPLYTHVCSYIAIACVYLTDYKDMFQSIFLLMPINALVNFKRIDLVNLTCLGLEP